MINGIGQNQQMALLSLSYIEAVAASSGFQVVEPKVDADSVDGILLADYGRRPRVEFQAKATTRQIARADGIHFPLSLKNYNDLRIETIVPRILVVLLMPESPVEWLNQTDQELCLRHCAYWRSLRGEPETVNRDNVTVHLPNDSIFDSDHLIRMMDTIEIDGAL